MEPRTKKILFGCLGGCGFFLLMFVGSCVALTVWLNSPGEVLEPQVLLGPETTGYIEWTLRLEDPGTAEFTEGMLQRLSEMNDETDSPLPDGMEQFLNARQMNSARKDLKKFFPLVVAWTARPSSQPGEDEYLFSASARGIGHQMIFLDWMLGMFLGWVGEVETVRHQGEKIYLLNETQGVRPAAFIHHGMVFVATDIDSARQTADRLKRRDGGSAAGTELGALFDTVPQDQSLRGALTNRGGELRRILDTLELPTEHVSVEAWDEVRGATVVANFRDDQIFGGTVNLHGPSADWAATYAPALGPALEVLFEQSVIDFETKVGHSGERIQVEFATLDVFDQIKELD